jgi:uncharacterized protein YggE
MSHVRRWLSGAALAVAIAGFGTAHADDAAPHILTVSGQGEVRAVPDQAQLSAGVVTEGKTAAAALAANSRAMNAVFAAIRKLGVPEKSIQTSNFEITPQYTSDRNDNTDAQRIVGYQASNQVTVILDDVSKVGPTLDALVASGANQASSIDFSIRDDKPLLAKAREAAVADAIARAQIYAKAAGVALGPILSIQESGTEAPMLPMMRVRFAGKESSTPVAAGEQDVSANVTITWEIK